MQINGISPPIDLSSALEVDSVEISDLSQKAKGEANANLNGRSVKAAGGSVHSPVAPIVWETVFETDDFWPKR